MLGMISSLRVAMVTVTAVSTNQEESLGMHLLLCSPELLASLYPLIQFSVLAVPFLA